MGMLSWLLGCFSEGDTARYMAWHSEVFVGGHYACLASEITVRPGTGFHLGLMIKMLMKVAFCIGPDAQNHTFFCLRSLLFLMHVVVRILCLNHFGATRQESLPPKRAVLSRPHQHSPKYLMSN